MAKSQVSSLNQLFIKLPFFLIFSIRYVYPLNSDFLEILLFSWHHHVNTNKKPGHGRPTSTDRPSFGTRNSWCIPRCRAGIGSSWRFLDHHINPLRKSLVMVLTIWVLSTGYNKILWYRFLSMVWILVIISHTIKYWFWVLVIIVLYLPVTVIAFTSFLYCIISNYDQKCVFTSYSFGYI